MDLSSLVRSLAEQAVPEPGTGRLRLPTERELGASLQVSRGSLREQLSMLEMLGFLDRTQGRGSYLQVPDAGFLRLYFDLSRQLGQLTHDQFSAAREMLEVSVAEAAAERVAEDDVAELRALVDAMVLAAGAGDHERALEADLAFHRRLFTVVDNPIFTLMRDGLAHVLRGAIVDRRRLAAEREPQADGSPRPSDAVHYEVVEALAARDGAAAGAAMRRHFVVWRAVVESAVVGRGVVGCSAISHS
ncbi:FadR/GntR family transcriptional regulator [Pseudonocardia cypriaca]|uniref:GntR family transcriptional regulator n=1 Tax=Pseudonocardia cypriaca TaxID=882449 RepID=A0A543FVX8_9PSEU|nr:FCD domain-containing protein [Pseudonocardia cypriaca]TQM37949.1 GntR family transcriptional regulator [Pseudonocardia cypriaca]